MLTIIQVGAKQPVNTGIRDEVYLTANNITLLDFLILGRFGGSQIGYNGFS